MLVSLKHKITFDNKNLTLILIKILRQFFWWGRLIHSTQGTSVRILENVVVYLLLWPTNICTQRFTCVLEIGLNFVMLGTICNHPPVESSNMSNKQKPSAKHKVSVYYKCLIIVNRVVSLQEWVPVPLGTSSCRDTTRFTVNSGWLK